MTKLRTHRLFRFAPARLCILVLFCFAAVIAAPAQGVYFTTLASFDGTDGASPYAGLVQGGDGNFYGTAWVGGNPNCNGGYGCGTVFKITPSGTITTLYNFCSQSNCTDGAFPLAPLVQGSDGNFYGTAGDGGASGAGTVFKITPGGTLTTLHSFDGTDGGGPVAGLVQATDGNFYGTASGGGTNDRGTVFKITPAGTLTRLYSFCAAGDPCPDGAGPRASLVEGIDGNFYGTTAYGGNNNCHGIQGQFGCGTVFKITPAGELTTMYSFCSQPQPNCTDGAWPYGWLVLASDGNFYGTTYAGGTNTWGTVFKITPAGVLTSFSISDAPAAGLVQGTDGNFYGTTSGANGSYGGVFKITPSGVLTTLHSFDGADGAWPWGGLVQVRDGSFYGTTYGGGAYNSDGTVFRLGVVNTCATCQP